MNGLALHGLLSDENGSDSEFVIEAAAEASPEDAQIDKAIAMFEAEQSSTPLKDLEHSLPLSTHIGTSSEDETLLESIEALKAKERQLASTPSQKKVATVERKSAPRMRRYFDSADSLKCFNCGERGHTSETCKEENVKPCFICAHPGHLERNCPNQLCLRCNLGGHVIKDCRFSGRVPRLRVCSRCGSRAHTLLDCTYQPQQNSADLASVRCFICGNYGHLCCRNSRKLNQKRPQFCSNCASQGHWHFDCPQQNRMMSYYDSLKSKPKIDIARNTVCFTCSKKGHMSRDCPDNSSRKENKHRPSEFEWCFVCQIAGHRAGECSGVVQKTRKRQREEADESKAHVHMQQGEQSNRKGNKRKIARDTTAPDRRQNGEGSDKSRKPKAKTKKPKSRPREQRQTQPHRDGRWVS